MERDLKKLVASMTLEEKAGMCSGADAEAGSGSRPPWIE